MKQGRGRLALLLACALTAVQAQAADELIRQGAELVRTGQGKAAYALLEPQEEARAGDKDFDLLFGIAALDVGQNTRAIFALERVLAVDPNNVRARAEIARAYLGVGETQAAKTEFQNAKQLGVPADVAPTIDRFLSAVERIENEGKPTVRAFIEGTLGYDTNVNAAPARGEVAIPAFGNVLFTLSDKSKAKEDWFGSVGGGVNFTYPVDKQLAIVGGVSGSQRWNMHVSSADLLNADASLGAAYTEGRNVYSFNLQYNTLLVDSDRFRNALGFSAQVQHNLDARNQISAFAQYSDLSYIGQPTRDADRWVAGAGYAHAWRDGLIGYGSLYSVTERVHSEAVSPYLSLDGYGARVGGQLRLNEKTVLFSSLAYETRRGKAIDPTFLTSRNDDQWIANVSVSYDLKKNLKLTGQYSYIDQRSNIEIYAYDRNMLSLTLRQDF